MEFVRNSTAGAVEKFKARECGSKGLIFEEVENKWEVMSVQDIVLLEEVRLNLYSAILKLFSISEFPDVFNVD